MSSPAAKAALSLFQRPATDQSGVGRSCSDRSAGVDDLPGKSLKWRQAPSSQALTNLDKT
jgi:hypothetical protein